MTDTTISVNQAQKESLIQFRSTVESETGRDISQGEAVSIAAQLADEHLQKCNVLPENDPRVAGYE